MIPMLDPRYVYTPRSDAVRRRQSDASKRRLGIPIGHVRLWGVHVPNDHAETMRAYAGWIRQKEGIEAAVSFLEVARVNEWQAEKPSPDKVRVDVPRYFVRRLCRVIQNFARATSRAVHARLSSIAKIIAKIARALGRHFRRIAAKIEAEAIRARSQLLRVIQAFAKWAMRWPTWVPRMCRVIQAFARLALDSVPFIKIARIVRRLSRLAMRPKRRPRADWGLLCELYAEHMTIDEIAAFAGVGVKYTKQKLKSRRGRP